MPDKKPWSGRFAESTDVTVEEFTESISYDKRLYRYDIMGSIAHAEALASGGIIEEAEKELIIYALKEIMREIEEGKFPFSTALEDIHMNIESKLIEKIGATGAKLHAGRSRNDQIALDIRLYLRDEIRNIAGMLSRFQEELLDLAREYKDTIIPGYTHLHHAQPVLFAHHIMAHISMYERDKERLQDCLQRMNKSPLGAASLAGSSLPIDRMKVAKELDFGGIIENSMDAVSDRDFAIELLSVLAITGMHLSRLSDELILWSTCEFGFIEIRESFCTGSSFMPQKKNPDVAELVRGKTGRLYGNLISLLTVMKGLPLTYNRDMQEDKEPLFDSIDTIKNILKVYIALFSNITLNEARIVHLRKRDYSWAADLAENLVKDGTPFREAHEVVGKLVAYCIEHHKELDEVTVEELRRISNKFPPKTFKWAKSETCIKSKATLGSTSYREVERRLKKWEKRLKKCTSSDT